MNKIQFTIRRFFRKLDFFSLFGVLGTRDSFRAIGASRASSVLGTFGHAIILMSLIDFVAAIIPPQVQNPVWELETINLLIGQIWFFLVGFALVLTSYLIRYYLDREARIPVLELTLFKFSRWLVLFIAVVCLLMPPLIIVDTVRVHRINTSQIGEATQNQLAQLSQVESQLEQVENIDQLQSLLPDNVSFPAGASLPNLKQQLRSSLASQKTQVSEQGAKLIGDKRFNLLETGFRNVMAALIASFCLFAFFWRTREFVD